MNNPLYAGLARVGAVLSSPSRLRALNFLVQRARTVGELAELLDESPANTAAHVKALRTAGLVTTEKRGRHVIVDLADPSVVRLLVALRETGEAVEPTVRLLQHDVDTADGAEVADLDVLALNEQTAKRSTWLLDLRPSEEFEAGHLPRARSVPYEELEQHVAELSPRRSLLIYCRGKYCPKAKHGTRSLLDAGFQAKRLPFGVAEWRAAGHPLEVRA